MVAVPIAFFAAAALLGKRFSKLLACASTLIILIIALALIASTFVSGTINLSESYTFLPSLSINFSLALDPISLLLVTMSGIVLFVAALAGDVGEIDQKKSAILLLLFQVGATGLFLSGNFLVFFVFWDVTLVASFFFINALGSGNRKTASFKFLIYEIFASSMLLLGIMMLYTSPLHSLGFQALRGTLPSATQLTILIAMMLAFFVNMPVFPLHSWMPDAYTEAPTRGTMLLSGILSKFGGYGALIVLSSLTISKSYALYIASLAAISIFYAAFSMLGQKDIKRALSYASMLEMGIVLLGISSLSAIGLEGAAFAMFAYGMIMALMFLDVGVLFYSFGERDIRVLKGVLIEGRGIAFAFIFGAFAMAGVPLTAVFVGDILVFLGAFSSFGAYALVPLLSIILLGAYLYFVIDKMFYRAKDHSKPVYVMDRIQGLGLALLVFFILLFGIMPFIVLNAFK